MLIGREAEESFFEAQSFLSLLFSPQSVLSPRLQQGCENPRPSLVSWPKLYSGSFADSLYDLGLGPAWALSLLGLQEGTRGLEKANFCFFLFVFFCRDRFKELILALKFGNPAEKKNQFSLVSQFPALVGNP